MRKILIATTALTLAGSAFASADISMYGIAALKSKDKKYTNYYETEVYVSESKTTATGITFGATETLGFSGNKAHAQSSFTSRTAGDDGDLAAQAAAVKAHKAVLDAIKDADKKTAATKAVNKAATKAYLNGQLGGIQAYHELQAFVSSPILGKITVGTQHTASRDFGGNSVNVGSYLTGSLGAVAGRIGSQNAVSYTSPKLLIAAGGALQGAVTYELNSDDTSKSNISYGVSFAKDDVGSGFFVKGAVGGYNYNTNKKVSAKTADGSAIDYIKPQVADTKNTRVISYGLEASYKGLSGSISGDNGNFVTGANALGQVATLWEKEKAYRFGGNFKQGPWSFGASYTTRKIEDKDAKVIVGDAVYTVASGFDIFAEYHKRSDFSDTFKSLNGEEIYVGTQISL